MSSSLQLNILRREPFAGGFEFEGTGAYERLFGRVTFRVDPNAVEQQDVVDIALAPRDQDGLVSFTADFDILKPVDLSRGNRRLFFDYGNRGNKRALQFFNDAVGSNDPVSLEHAGNGFLMRRGYTIAWLAWQGDLLPGDNRLLLQVPVATENGKSISGQARVEFVPLERTTTFPLSTQATTRSYPVASLSEPEARLTRRRYAWSERELIDSSSYEFARIERSTGIDNQGSEEATIPSDVHITLRDGFEPGWIYELVYEAKDPLVLGLGHVGVRNFIRFLKYDECDSIGQVNPLRDKNFAIEKAYAWGRSQTGRCIRDFVYRGYNDDGLGRRVFDGVMPHVAGAGKMWMNHRFANLVVVVGQDYENHFVPADRFPFSYALSTDSFTGREDAILRRPDTDPLVIHTDSASEYWHRRASLVHTDTDGNDLPQPDNVRIYFWASSQHFASPLLKAPGRGIAHAPVNPVTTSMFFRANLDALDRWATDNLAPPPSRIPLVADQTLVSASTWRSQFPAIPGAVLPSGPSRLELMDFGPEEDHGILFHNPPLLDADKEYPVLVPAVDTDGNDQGGIRAPMAAVPLGTYVGWSMRRSEFGAGAMVGITGSYFPFSESLDERKQTGDPRPAILERFKNASAYTAAIEEAVKSLVNDKWVLPEDEPRAIALSADWGRPRHLIRSL